MMAGIEHDALVVQLRAEVDQLRAERDQLRALLLDRSAERDQWVRRTLSDWAAGYQAGFESGAEVGYGQAVIDWKVTAAGMTKLGGPTFAELDRRRYPPGGRLSWIILRPGEACVHEAAGLGCECEGRRQ